MLASNGFPWRILTTCVLSWSMSTKRGLYRRMLAAHVLHQRRLTKHLLRREMLSKNIHVRRVFHNKMLAIHVVILHVFHSEMLAIQVVIESVCWWPSHFKGQSSDRDLEKGKLILFTITRFFSFLDASSHLLWESDRPSVSQSVAPSDTLSQKSLKINLFREIKARISQVMHHWPYWPYRFNSLDFYFSID